MWSSGQGEKTTFYVSRDSSPDRWFFPGEHTKANRRMVPNGCFSRGALAFPILSRDENLSRTPPESQRKRIWFFKRFKRTMVEKNGEFIPRNLVAATTPLQKALHLWVERGPQMIPTKKLQLKDRTQ